MSDTPTTSAAVPSREDLIALCDRGVVPQDRWHDRDSAGAQKQLAHARTLLLAGCDYRLADSPEQTDDTVWVEITYEGFNYVEMGAGYEDTDTFYVPTAARLERTAGRDWY